MSAPAGSSAIGLPAEPSAEDLSRLGARLPGVLESDIVERLAVLATFDPEMSVPPKYLLEVQVVSDRLADRGGGPEWMLKERLRVNVLAPAAATGRPLRAGPGAG